MFGAFAALTGFALRGASALLGEDAQDKLAAANAKSALQAYRLNQSDLVARVVQARAAAAQQSDVIGQQGQAATSTAAASAAESGVAGTTVNQILDQYSAETALAQGTVQRNLGYTEAELARRRESSRIEYESRLAGVQPGSSTVAALKVGGALLDTLPYLGIGR